MIRRWLLRTRYRLRYNTALRHRSSSTSGRGHAPAEQDVAKAAMFRTRNIGIIAHIDAGKTTTTERMLYYSGYTRRLGDVDDGSTVTDFLPAERARGITIQSAAISFQWPPLPFNVNKPPPLSGTGLPRSSVSHNINLIDTPGHADFTFEVIRSLRVLDGAICILDGVAGVEAQTEKVWSQAETYRIPRIVFVNKLDRDGAAFGRTVKEVAYRLGVWPAVCAIPWWRHDAGEHQLRGVGDVVSLQGLAYKKGGDGREIEVFPLQRLEAEDDALAAEMKKARTALVELLSEHDDEMVENYLQADEDHLAISAPDIRESLRRCLLQHSQSIAPVFAGASFRNVGVQPLLDAVVDLLPSPSERPDPDISFGSSAATGKLSAFLAGQQQAPAASQTETKALKHSRQNLEIQLRNLEACALAFKVVVDAKRGVLVYLRVYSGTLTRNAILWNTTLRSTERAQKLLKMYANDAVEIDTIPAGQIGVVPGLKSARTGDTLIAYAGANVKTGPPQPLSSLQLRPIDVPPPVFFVSVEPNSLGEEGHVKESLQLLLREDPSLHVSVDEESGQTLLSGMGELHLEIARDRLVDDLKAKARIGRVEIGYRETMTAASDTVDEVVERDVGGKTSKAGVAVRVEPAGDGEVEPRIQGGHMFHLSDGNRLLVATPTLKDDGTPAVEGVRGLTDDLPLSAVLNAYENGVNAAMVRGPTYRYPVHSTQVNITFEPQHHIFANTTPAALSSAARLAVQKAMKGCDTTLMEPVMRVVIQVDEATLGAVVQDLESKRGGSVLSLGQSDNDLPNPGAEERRRIDTKRVYAPPDPFAGGHSSADDVEATSATTLRHVVARVPLKEMVGYLKHLRSLTGGRGTFTMTVDRFERMNAARQKVVLNEMSGEQW